MIITVMFYILHYITNLARKEWVIFIGLYFPKKRKKREKLAWLFQLESKSKLLEIHMNLSTCSVRQARWEPPINYSQVSTPIIINKLSFLFFYYIYIYIYIKFLDSLTSFDHSKLVSLSLHNLILKL